MSQCSVAHQEAEQTFSYAGEADQREASHEAAE